MGCLFILVVITESPKLQNFISFHVGIEIIFILYDKKYYKPHTLTGLFYLEKSHKPLWLVKKERKKKRLK